MRIALALLYWSTSAVLAVPVLHTALDAVEQIHVSFAVPDASDESAQTMLAFDYTLDMLNLDDDVYDGVNSVYARRISCLAARIPRSSENGLSVTNEPMHEKQELDLLRPTTVIAELSVNAVGRSYMKVITVATRIIEVDGVEHLSDLQTQSFRIAKARCAYAWSCRIQNRPDCMQRPACQRHKSQPRQLTHSGQKLSLQQSVMQDRPSLAMLRFVNAVDREDQFLGISQDMQLNLLSVAFYITFVVLAWHLLVLFRDTANYLRFRQANKKRRSAITDKVKILETITEVDERDIEAAKV